VLIHAGMLTADDPATVAGWREGMQRLAEQPNVNVKLSGLGTFIHRVDPDFISFVVRETVGMFGADRCVFGSNFPIEKLWTDFPTLWAAYQQALAPFTDEDRDAMLRGTATRLYRL
jgi:predicted TIM-barrel fold metal-dependent hydrolase